MNEKWIAYCAGLYEGEGCVSCTIYDLKRLGKTFKNQRKIHLEIRMTNLIPLELFEETFEVGCITGPYSGKKENHKPFYDFTINKLKDIKYVMELMIPYLSPIRQEQYKLVIEKYETWGGTR